MKNLLHTLLAVLLLLVVGANGLPKAATCDQAIVDRVMAMFELDTVSYRIEVLSNPLRTAELSPGDLSIFPMTQKEPLGLYSIRVTVRENGETVESGQVRLRIKKFADVLVLLDRIKRHETLSPEKFTIRKMDVTNLRERPLLSFEALAGHRAKRNLRKGDLLTTGDMELTPDIEAGREVSIVFYDGLCRITAVGTALQSGLVGEYIKVKNKSSKKIILARVVDQTAVAIDP